MNLRDRRLPKPKVAGSRPVVRWAWAMADGYERASDGYDWAAVWPERATFDEAFKDVRRSCKQIGEQSLTDLVGDATLSFSIAMAYPGTVGDAFLWEWEWTPREPHPDAALKAR